jgi:hypothetical protein
MSERMLTYSPRSEKIPKSEHSILKSEHLIPNRLRLWVRQ